jgi:hypothetical protein
VAEKLRQDAGIRLMIDRIRAVTADVPAPDPITRCPGTASATAAAGDTGPAGLDGIYTSTVTAKALHDAGERNEQKILENSGRFTWTLHAGTWKYRQESDFFLDHTEATGRYTYDHGVFTLYWSERPGGWTRAQLWVAANGTISFTGIVDGRPAAQDLAEGFFSSPWIRAGNVPR